jgi:hypothetical protein
MIYVWTLLIAFAGPAHQVRGPVDRPATPVSQPVEHSHAQASEDHGNIDVSRCLMAGESPSERVSPRQMIAPGLPPLLSFRYYEGRAHYRFGNNDLMLDDAGH